MEVTTRPLYYRRKIGVTAFDQVWLCGRQNKLPEQTDDVEDCSDYDAECMLCCAINLIMDRADEMATKEELLDRNERYLIMSVTGKSPSSKINNLFQYIKDNIDLVLSKAVELGVVEEF